MLDGYGVRIGYVIHSVYKDSILLLIFETFLPRRGSNFFVPDIFIRLQNIVGVVFLSSYFLNHRVVIALLFVIVIGDFDGATIGSEIEICMASRFHRHGLSIRPSVTFDSSFNLLRDFLPP